MSELTPQEVAGALAALAGVPAPDLQGQSAVGDATARVHLTNLATQAGATWQAIADIYGHGIARKAKRDHRRLEADLRQQLALRQNAN